MMAECTHIVQTFCLRNLACYCVLFGNIREMIFYKAENVTQAVMPFDDSLGDGSQAVDKFPAIFDVHANLRPFRIVYN